MTEYLSVWYTEAQNELRWRREVEYKLLSANLTFYGLVTAGIGLGDISSATANTCVIPALVVMAFLVIALLSVYKVIHDNRAYKNIAQSVAKWCKYTEIPDEILPPDIDKYGLGKGHLKTCAIILFAALMSSVIVVAKYTI